MNSEKLDSGAKKLVALQEGDAVYIQDQTGASPKQWNKSGVVIQSLPYDSFLIKVDGSNTVTKRNRQFLRRYTPFAASLITTTDGSEPLEKQDYIGSMVASSDLTPVQLAAYRAMDTPILTMLAMNSLAASQDQSFWHQHSNPRMFDRHYHRSSSLTSS